MHLPFQSACCKYYSTEKLTTFCSQSHCSLDKEKVTALILLHKSSAFHTTDHEILLCWLEHLYAHNTQLFLSLDSFSSNLAVQPFLDCSRLGIGLHHVIFWQFSDNIQISPLSHTRYLWNIIILQTVLLSMANALISSWLDYCNSLLTGINKSDLHKL